MMAASLKEFSSHQEAGNVLMQPTKQEIINCAITSWYKHFNAITFPSELLPLPKGFIEYLLSDGCVLPQGCSLPSLEVDGRSSDSDEEELNWSEEEPAQAPVFTELIQCIDQGIEDLGGAVLPKLNWSSPRDAVWMAPSNSLRCTCAAEVILLLKSSNFITHDLTRVFKYCSSSISPEPEQPFSYQLCLRRWENIHPSSEFRCFVHSSKLIGVCQRNHTACYKHLLDIKDNLQTEITTFFENIKGKFPNENYIFDVCRIKENKYWLIDFGPYCPMTDPLLFSWEELSGGVQRLSSQAVELPVVRLADAQTVQPSDLQTCRLPQDLIDIASGEDVHKFADLFLKGSIPGQDSDSD